MKNKYVAFFLFLTMMGIFPISSCVDQCDGPCGCYPVFENPDFTISAFSVENLYRADNNFIVDPNRYYFHQTLYKAFWVSGLREIANNSPSTSGSFFSNMAFACSPPESFSTETLKSIRIINKKRVQINQQEILEIGQQINDYFNLTLTFQVEYSIDDFLKRNHKFLKDERLYLKFNSPPNDNIEIMFDIEIELDNDKTFVFNNETMKVNGG